MLHYALLGEEYVSRWRRRRGVGCGRVHGHARSGWEAGMAQGGVSRGVCAGVVGVRLRARRGAFLGEGGRGRAAAWLCIEALTEDVLMQTSGAAALALLTVLYWCVCVCVLGMR